MHLASDEGVGMGSAICCPIITDFQKNQYSCTERRGEGNGRKGGLRMQEKRRNRGEIMVNMMSSPKRMKAELHRKWI